MSEIEQPSQEAVIEAQRRAEWETLAARYALGELDPECRRAVDTLARLMPAFQQLLVDSEDALAMLPGIAPAIAPAPGLWDRLHDRLALAPEVLIRATARSWLPGATEGIEQCALNRDVTTGLVTSLIRMRAGARIEPHWHSGDEQCLVLSGSVEWGSERLAAGDFVVAPGGSVLPEIRAAEPNLLLIVGPADGRRLGESIDAGRSHG